jgi:hypothetical protein
MRREPIARRSFLSSALALAGCGFLLGCDGGGGKEVEVTKQEDPAAKAKESMEFYKNNMMKKGASKK